MNPLERSFSFALRHPRSTVLFFLLLILGLGSGLHRAHLELDIYDVLDQNFPTTVALFDMREKFGDTNSIQFVFSPQASPLNADQACQIQDFFRHYSNQNAELQAWLSPWRLRRPVVNGDKLWYPTLLPDPCESPAQQSIEADLKLLDATPWARLLTDRHHQDFSVSVSFADQEEADGSRRFDVAAISRLKDALDSFLKSKGTAVSYEMSGQAAFRWYFKKMLSKDAIFHFALLILFLLFFRVFFGTWKSGAFFIFTLFYTVICLYGLLCWLGFPIDLLTNNLFLMTAIAAVADFLFVSASQEEGDWQRGFHQILVPGFFTTLTTFIGFWSLMISDIRVIQRFGFAAGCGALLEWVATFLVLPAVLQMTGFKGSWFDREKSWRPSLLLKLLALRPRRRTTAALCAAMLLSLWAGSHLNFSDTPTKNFPPSHELHQAFLHLQEKRGWESTLFVVFKPQATAEFQKQVLDEIKQQPQVVDVDTALGFESFLTKGLDPLQKDMVMREVQPTALYKRYRQKDGTSRSMILLRSSSVEELGVVSSQIRRLCGDLCEPVGQNEVFREYSSRVSKTLAESFLLSLVIVLLILFALAWHRGIKRLKHYWALTLSILWGPVMMIVFLWVFQIPINVVTSVFLAVIVGMTGDNAIQYIFAGKTIASGIEERGMASLLVSVLLCLASLTFLGQTLVPVRILGMLFFLGFLATIFGDLWTLKGLLQETDQDLP